MKRSHATLSGHVLEYEATPEIDAFLARLEALVRDPSKRENDLIDLAYSKENPLLDKTTHPTRGWVTREAFENPAYRVISDLLFRKRVAQDGLDVAAVATRYSLSIVDAAAELGVSEATVRAALRDRELGSWIKDGEPFIDPGALHRFRPSRSASLATKEITFDHLVDAHFSAAEWANAAAELRDYHVLRRDLLERLFGCSLAAEESFAGPIHVRAQFEAARDRRAVAGLARRCVNAGAASHSPFGGYLEGGPGPREAAIWKERRAPFEEALAALQAQYRAVARHALATLFPAATKLRFPERVLVDNGLPETAPDPDDFW